LQGRRLVAAKMPESFFFHHGGDPVVGLWFIVVCPPKQPHVVRKSRT
jgi:hypothetical protein